MKLETCSHLLIWTMVTGTSLRLTSTKLSMILRSIWALRLITLRHQLADSTSRLLCVVSCPILRFSSASSIDPLRNIITSPTIHSARKCVNNWKPTQSRLAPPRTSRRRHSMMPIWIKSTVSIDRAILLKSMPKISLITHMRRLPILTLATWSCLEIQFLLPEAHNRSSFSSRSTIRTRKSRFGSNITPSRAEVSYLVTRQEGFSTLLKISTSSSMRLMTKKHGSPSSRTSCSTSCSVPWWSWESTKDSV